MTGQRFEAKLKKVRARFGEVDEIVLRERASFPPILYRMECSRILESSRDDERRIQKQLDADKKKSGEENKENRKEQRRAPIASVLRIDWRERCRTSSLRCDTIDTPRQGNDNLIVLNKRASNFTPKIENEESEENPP